jgi:DNA mismatch endonuclease (patch repair protein)
VFPRERVAVFVDGCFWHGCPDHGTIPKANTAWWREKIRANAARDADTIERLQGAGWLAVRVWEHERPELASERVAEEVARRRFIN